MADAGFFSATAAGALAVGVVLGMFLRTAFRYIWPIITHIVTPAVNLKKLAGTEKKVWAVVTGSSDSLGRDYAYRLAEMGFNVALISRTRSKLEDVARTIEEKYGVSTKVMPVDFAAATDDTYDMIALELDGLDIAVLINNVGFNQEFPEYFHKVSRQVHKDIIQVTLWSCFEMCRLFAERLADREGGGVIINLASVGGLNPVPFLINYSAVKRAIVEFSRGLQTEFRGTGLTIQCVAPGVFVSNMSKVRKPSTWSPMPDLVAKNSLASVGKSILFVPCWSHRFTWFAMEALPYHLSQASTAMVNLKYREKAYAKRARQAGETSAEGTSDHETKLLPQ